MVLLFYCISLLRHKNKYIFIYFFSLILSVYFENERVRESKCTTQEGQRKREYQAGSILSGWSLMRGSVSQTELKPRLGCLNEPPTDHFFQLFLKSIFLIFKSSCPSVD